MKNPDIYKAWERPEATIHLLFREAVQREPHRMAVVDGDVQLTYAELDRLSDCLAAYLIQKGAKQGGSVALFMTKSYYYLVACLAALKTGSAYLHIDEGYSSETIFKILSENSPSVLVTDSKMPHLTLNQNIGAITLDEQDDWKKTAPLSGEGQPMSSQAIAIIGYTSGTTGFPKGVAVSHRAAIYSFCKFWEELKDIPKFQKDIFGYITYLTWDAMSPLLFNATGVIVSYEKNHDVSEILASLKKHSINHAFLTPSLFKELLNTFSTESLKPFFSKMKVMWLGGEIIDPDLIENVYEQFPHLLLFNNYGPTECFVVSQGLIHPEDFKIKTGIPAGFVLPEIDFVLLDEHLQNVTSNGIGYLYVSGPALADGYINLPDLTEKKFITMGSARYYATGDYCCLLADGRLTVLGRDSFVFSSGRAMIVLADIEKQVKKNAQLKECVAVKSTRPDGQPEILLFYIIDPNFDTRSILDSISAILADNSTYYRCFELTEVPKHPVSQKINYSILLKMAKEAHATEESR